MALFTTAGGSARRAFDPVGHYARPDIFQLTVDRRPRNPVSFTER